MMNLLLNKEMPVVCGDKLSQFVLNIDKANKPAKWTRQTELMGGDYLADIFSVNGAKVFAVDKFDTVYDERGNDAG